MLVNVQSKDRSTLRSFSDKNRGAYWITDHEGTQLAFVEAKKDGWHIEPASQASLVSSKPQNNAQEITLPFDKSITFGVEKNHKKWSIFCRPSTDGDKILKLIGVAGDISFTIGRDTSCSIVYPSPYVSSLHATLSYRDGSFFIIDNKSANGVFVNGVRIPKNQEVPLKIADTISLLGLYIIVGEKMLALNNPLNELIICDDPKVVVYKTPSMQTEEQNAQEETHFFYPALRFPRAIERKEFRIDPPPQQEIEDDTPIAMKIGPSLAMALASVLSAGVSIMYMTGSDGSSLRAIPMIAMAIAMLSGSILWPILNTHFQHKKNIEREGVRRIAYSQYLSKVRSRLQKEANLQKEILEENRISPQVCLEVAKKKSAPFMARLPLHKDYMELRLGIGDLPLNAQINFPSTNFEIREDDLRKTVNALAKEPQRLRDVPLGYSFISSPVIGLVGSKEFTEGLMRNLLVQIAALHSYEDVKIAMMCDSQDADAWQFARHLPHAFSNDKNIRFFSSSVEEANSLTMYFSKVLEERLSQSKLDAREAKPLFVLACPSKAVYDKSKFIKGVLELKDNKGFMVISCAEEMHELPRQCRFVVGEDEAGNAYLLNRDDPTGEKKPFSLDNFVTLEEAERFTLDVSSVKLDITETQERLPDSLSFMDMFDTNHIAHLNVADRWRENNAADSLATSIGLDEESDLFKLDLHEDFHGPHGLIAGTTGSGKSEFIITYVLSMALNYSPEEVAFVLIDYKGGGLAKAFDNDRFRLPHVAGTITNLDGSAISRSLASIRSELKRRQQLFNEAREILGGDNVDIYKYLNLYRQGKVTEPCPHLILIADEFAELKQQEPEFMDELISTSRIGRSLGVHLILATQKPSGVVNDQIWSNSRFKIALKVADAADSKEIIKRSDAAEISQPGRFFLLVGYNELFMKGQSAYSGAKYVEGKRKDSDKNQTVSCVSNVGRTILSMKSDPSDSTESKKTQIVAVCEQVVEVGKEQKKKARMLWLPPIPQSIFLSDVSKQFKRKTKDDFVLNPVVGMYDDPAHQSQHLLTLPLSKEGNAIVYGSADVGTEQVIRALLYSLIAEHSPNTLNMYLLDFGSQALTAFASAPHVGDVVLMGEDEKVKRFFTYMATLIAKRRALFAKYGGSFERYCKEHKDLPAILVVINGMSAFFDSYSAYEEDLLSFAREASRVGINIVLVAETASSVRMRLKNHFRQVLACDIPDPTDYNVIVGPLKGLAPPHGYGRGVVRIEDEVYEFQAASVCSEDQNEFESIQQTSEDLAKKYADQKVWAPSIPLPPNKVDAKMLRSIKGDKAGLPFGIFDDSLALATFDFSELPMQRVAFQRSKTGSAFMLGLIEAWTERGDIDVIVLDLDAILSREPAKCVLATRRDEIAKKRVESLVAKAPEKPTVLMISGVIEYLKRCQKEDADLLKELLKSVSAKGNLKVLLFDAAHNANYTFEDWFKCHLTNRDGLWIGPGIEGQSAISTAYTRGVLPDAKMSAKLGYMIQGGILQLVHVITKEKE